MSFTFNWPRFSDQFHYDAIQMLNTALNKGNKPPIIADRIQVVELEMGSQVSFLSNKPTYKNLSTPFLATWTRNKGYRWSHCRSLQRHISYDLCRRCTSRFKNKSPGISSLLVISSKVTISTGQSSKSQTTRYTPHGWFKRNVGRKGSLGRSHAPQTISFQTKLLRRPRRVQTKRHHSRIQNRPATKCRYQQYLWLYRRHPKFHSTRNRRSVTPDVQRRPSRDHPSIKSTMGKGKSWSPLFE